MNSYIHPEGVYYYDLRRSLDILINPQHFIIEYREKEEHREKRKEILRVNFNKQILEKMQVRFLEEGGVNREDKDKFLGSYFEATGRLSKMIQSGILQRVETPEGLIKKLL